MSDTVTLPGTGSIIATDQVTDGTLGSVQVQYVKLMGGALDDTTKVGANSNGLLVDGSGVTQPVSLSSVPTHAVTQSGTWTVQPGNTANTTAWKVDGSAVTQPVSASSLPLPSGAASSAKQPALGTAGTASSDVLTVQGITSMTALKVDGSAVTQPVSGTVTVQQSTASSLKVDLSGTAANTTAIKVDGSAVTQPVSVSSVPTHAVTQSGTWTVQPGNTANTTAWKVDGSAVTQPVSGSVTATLSSTTNAGATAKTTDYDTGAGTDTVTLFGVALPASGGAVAGGTATNPIRVDPTGTTTQPVSGTVTANAGTGTMAVSAASLPLPSGASTSAKQPALGTAGSASADVITVQGVASMTALKVDGSAATQPVSGTFWQSTQPVSATSLPLPSGASTSAKQPALGTAGTAASDVLTVQGIASMTALKVDGSAVTQPVSGTFWQATQPVSGTVSATLTSTTNAGATAKSSDYDTGAGTDTVTMFGIALPASGGAVQGGTATNPIQVSLANTASNSTAVKVDASGTTVPVSGTFWQSTQPVSGTVTVQQSTASSLKVDLSGTAANATAIKVDGSAATQPVSQSGTWTVQPGNTANTTAWKVDGSAVTQPVSGTVTVQQATASSLKVDLSGTAANATAIKIDGSAVTQPVSGTVSAEASAATATTGSITANAQSIPSAVAGYSHVGVSINGTYAGVNLAFEFSDDGGTTYYSMQMTRSDSSVIETTSGALSNTSRAWDATVPSCTHFRVRSTAFTSGTAAIRIIPSAFPAVYNVTGNFRVTDATATNFLPTMDAAARRGFMTVTDGTNSMPTGDAVARAVFQKVTDGTNTSAVKAASTAPAATDPALVVSVSPNTPTLLVQTVPGTANGWSASSQTALSNTKTQVKSSAGLFGGYMMYNPNATVIYIQVWDVALASVTVGTTAPTYVIPIPGTAGANLEIQNGITHGTAIVIAATTTPTGSTAPGTALVGFILNK